MVGQEDVYRDSPYSCTLKCHSQKGTLLLFPKEVFMKLRKIDVSWQEVLKQIAVRSSRLASDDINPASRTLVLKHKRAEL